MLELANYSIYRNNLLKGHLTYLETKKRLYYLQSNQNILKQIKYSYSIYRLLNSNPKIKYFACIRESIKRYESMYKYIKQVSPTITGHFFENDLFNQISFNEYVDILYSRKYYGMSHAWNDQKYYFNSLDGLNKDLTLINLKNIEKDMNKLFNNETTQFEPKIVRNKSTGEVKLEKDTISKILMFESEK